MQCVHVFNLSGTYLRQIKGTTDPLIAPAGLCVDSSETALYVADKTLKEFALDGGEQRASHTLHAGSALEICDVRVTDNGMFYVCDNNLGRVACVSVGVPPPGFLKYWFVSCAGKSKVSWIALTPRRTLLAFNSVSLLELTLTRGDTMSACEITSSHPRGGAIDHNGDIYLCDEEGMKVFA